MSGFYKPSGGEYPPMFVRETSETVEQVREYPYLVNPARGIRPEVYKALGFRMALDPKDGVTPIAAYYPILKKGKLVAWKKRDYRKPKKSCFSIIGQADYTCDLIGSQKLKPGKRLVVVEGEEDLAAAYQAMQDQINSNPKWKGKVHPNVVSIAGGAPYAAEQISNNMEIVKQYEMLVTAFDNDKCTRKEYSKGMRKGYEATCEVQLLVGFKKCRYIPFTLKDPSEYVQNGKQSELAELLAFGMIEFTPVSIEDGADYTLDELMVASAKGIEIKCIPKTSELIGGLRDYEATLLLAPEKSGKSSLTKQIAYDIMIDGLNNDEKIGHIFLEEHGKKTRQSFLALDNGISLPEFRANPSILSPEKAQASYDKLFASGKNIFLNTKEGKLKPEQVVDHLRYMFAKGCKKIIFDHLSMVVSGSENDNERKEIDNLLTDIAAFCESNPVHVFVIAHIKRGNWQPKKDESGDIIYPYWRPVNAEDARGSASFGQLFWNCICIEPEVIDEFGNIGRVRTKVAFCREWGSKGLGDTLRWDKDSGRLVLTN